ncbi:MAG TPA: ATPase [Candidatus Alistipes intestinigallinarum]|uniref:ATPase n=1 Tax=Candidatus Alistipes intestinigallinarum TaxID=2838440 RepID=A0A9D1Z187_9BACT|nr:ATPase [Candidatus Alistipes intestinigallinarum]
MILLADSGSTQCTWIADDGVRMRTLRTRGINAVQHSDEQILSSLAELPRLGTVAAVRFYGAGCGRSFPETSERLRQLLAHHFGTQEVTVESDLTGAARALWGHGEGIACILGTGSNSCLCRGGEIVRQVPPLGYILGDEGSGAALGRGLLNGIFKGHIPLRDEFLTETGLSYEEIIRRVYREPFANRFLASFAPFVRAHTACPEVRGMVIGAFREFARRNLSRYPAGIPVACVGGVAAHFEELLREALAAEGYSVKTIVESPAEGLAAYHHGEQNHRTEFGIR